MKRMDGVQNQTKVKKKGARKPIDPGEGASLSRKGFDVQKTVITEVSKVEYHLVPVRDD